MDEERVTYGALIAIGLPVVVIELVRGAAFGALDTLAVISVIAGAVGLVRAIRAQVQLPSARLHRD